MDHKFFQVVRPSQLVELLRGFQPLGKERLDLQLAHGRVLRTAALAGEDLPLCCRATMDGYAVRAADTFGASEGNPAYLDLAGTVDIDRPADFTLAPGQCAAITTGGCLPQGSDAVSMVEHTQALAGGVVEIRRSLAPQDNMILRGEDVQQGHTAVAVGTLLRPQEVGLLAALGHATVDVGLQPRVAVLSTGDELVEVTITPRPGQVRDVNSYAVCAMAEQAGAKATALGLVPDELVALTTAIGRALEHSDVLFLSGGSSVGVRDLTVAAIESFSDGQVLAHGVQISPGKPTILARIGNKAVFGLPGQVTSAQVVMHIFGIPFLRWIQGDVRAFDPSRRPLRRAILERNVASRQGREDYVRVSLAPRPNALPVAVPRLGKSGLLKTLVQADGLVVIDAALEGLRQGSEVDVWLI